MNVRPVTPDDLTAVAELHVASWEAAYRGLMPDAVLDAQSVQPRIESWSRFLERPPVRGDGLWLAERAGAPVGMARTGPARVDVPEADLAELYALYVHPASFGRGIGRALLAHALAHLRAAPFERVCLKVLDGNERAIRFYEAAGFRRVGTVQPLTLPGREEVLPHLRYEAPLERPNRDDGKTRGPAG